MTHYIETNCANCFDLVSFDAETLQSHLYDDRTKQIQVLCPKCEKTHKIGMVVPGVFRPIPNEFAVWSPLMAAFFDLRALKTGHFATCDLCQRVTYPTLLRRVHLVHDKNHQIKTLCTTCATFATQTYVWALTKTGEVAPCLRKETFFLTTTIRKHIYLCHDAWLAIHGF